MIYLLTAIGLTPGGSSTVHYLGGSSPLCALTCILISGYVRQTRQYLLEL